MPCKSRATSLTTERNLINIKPLYKLRFYSLSLYFINEKESARAASFFYFSFLSYICEGKNNFDGPDKRDYTGD